MASETSPKRLPIYTQHCNYCNHLLLATTRNLSTLPRRAGESQDKAIILPLERNTQTAHEQKNEQNEQNEKISHTTLLLATTIPDRRATVIDRQDGIEKRILLRCGRCRVVFGYYLDKAHWAKDKKKESVDGEGDEEGAEEERPPAVYILPGALIETEDLGEGAGVGELEWRSWNNSS